LIYDELVSGDFNILVDCLTDTFEDNKMEAYKLLKHWSDLDIMKQVCVYYLLLFQLYQGSLFFIIEGNWETHQPSQITDKLYHIMLYQSALHHEQKTNSQL
jgi:hypothetical protein